MLNLAGQYLNLRILSRKLEILTVGVWYVENITLWANFHLSLVFLCALLDHVDSSHLTSYCSQLTGSYIICKNAENVEHLEYCLRVCQFLCHFFFLLYEYSWFLLAINWVCTSTLNKVIVIIIIIILMQNSWLFPPTNYIFCSLHLWHQVVKIY